MEHFANRRLALLLVFALAACAGNGSQTLSPASAPNVTIPRESVSANGGRNYLWVARTTDRHVQLIERHLLHDGIPERAADFTIHQNGYVGYGEFIAVAADGTLFVTGDGDNANPIYAFAPGGHRPERSFYVPQSASCFTSPSDYIDTTGLAADSKGYTFVSFTTYAGGAGPHRKMRKGHRYVCDGVWVFAPDAQGYAVPVATIYYQQADFVTALSVDPSDNLYVALDATKVIE
ncbi:MAG TPA: hypothetical protein VGF18_04695, partial [Candidatus Tumulicola sp.]